MSERAGMIRICDLMGPVHPSSVFVRKLADEQYPGESEGYTDTDPAGEARGLHEALDALEAAGLPIPNVQARLRELDERVAKEPQTAPESTEGYGGCPSEPEPAEEAEGDTEVGL